MRFCAGLFSVARSQLMAGLLVIAVGLGGCGNAERSSGRSSGESAVAEGRGILVSSFQFKHWPLTVDHGEIRCDKGFAIVFTAPNGIDYGVNGSSHGMGYQDIDRIARPGDFGALIDAGQKLC